MPMLRPELTRPPARIAQLPIDPRGYPVPWFVAWVDGQPEFRAMDPHKWVTAVQQRRCWVCGQQLGQYLTFVVGPMCGINLTTAEPPCHKDCAEWSAQNCPFLSRPHAKRREDDAINAETMAENAAGNALTRNPGVTLLWTTKAFRVFDDGKGRPLIQMGVPTRVAWIAEGRNARRSEVLASIDGGLPALLAACDMEPSEVLKREARAELRRRVAALSEMFPLDDEPALAVQ